jgi:PAS domain S-box-containing protein
VRFNKLSHQILLVFVLVIIVFLGVCGWYMLHISENIVTRKISDGDQNFAGRIAQEVAAEMASVRPTLTLLAGTAGLRSMEAIEVEGEIDRVQSSFPEITSIYVADVEGRQIARTGTEELEDVSKIWSFQVARGGDELVSDIYLKPATSEPMQTITLPIIDNKEVVGVLSADINFGIIMLSVMDIDVGGNGNVVVVAEDGRVVAHTHMEQVPELDLSKLAVVEAVLAGEGGTMRGYTDELGRQVFGAYMPIEELGWGVVIQRPLADIAAEVGQLRTTILWAMVAGMFLAVLVGGLMSRQITKPIRQLASASERVAQGDLSTPVDVKSSSEVGVLANSFNQMMVSLRKSRDELQQWGEELEAEISERKQAEEALREAEEKYKKLVEATSDMIWESDEMGTFTFVSSRIKNILGYKVDEVVGKKRTLDFAPEEEKRKWLGRFKEVNAKREPFSGFEITHLHKNGNLILLETSGIPFFDSAGNFKGFIGINKDITERKKMQEQLVIADRLASVGELASGIAHELNNPLTGVIGFAQIALDKDIPDDIKKDIQVVYSEAQRAAQVVKNLLTFARKHPPAKQLMSINIIIEKVLEIRAYEQRVNNIQVNTHFAPELPEVMADYFQLQQVFLNIVINAEYFMIEAHNGGNLTITTEMAEDTIRASFADDGPGIAEENLGHLFDPFFTTKEVGSGTGLGLSICHGIVAEHGGRIYAESEPGKGATFIVELPIGADDEKGGRNEKL